MDIWWTLNPCIPGSNLGNRMNFLNYFQCFLSLLLQCKFANSTLLSLLRFSYSITPYDAQASSAFSALIISAMLLLAVSQFSLRQQTGESVIAIPLKGLELFSTLYPRRYEYNYPHFQNSQKFALSAGVCYNILTQSDHCHTGSVHFCINLLQ